MTPCAECQTPVYCADYACRLRNDEADEWDRQRDIAAEEQRAAIDWAVAGPLPHNPQLAVAIIRRSTAEIARLRAENKRLRVALVQIAQAAEASVNAVTEPPPLR